MTEREHILWKHVSTDDLIIAMSSADDLIRKCALYSYNGYK